MNTIKHSIGWLPKNNKHIGSAFDDYLEDEDGEVMFLKPDEALIVSDKGYVEVVLCRNLLHMDYYRLIKLGVTTWQAKTRKINQN